MQLPHIEINAGLSLADTNIKVDGIELTVTHMKLEVCNEKFNVLKLGLLAAPIKIEGDMLTVVSLVDGKQYEFSNIREIEPMPADQLADVQSDCFQPYFDPNK